MDEQDGIAYGLFGPSTTEEMPLMTDDPFSLRRFGFYSEQDVAMTRDMFVKKYGPMTDTFSPGEQILEDSFVPEAAADGERIRREIAYLVAYWTPERRARAVQGELS